MTNEELKALVRATVDTTRRKRTKGANTITLFDEIIDRLVSSDPTSMLAFNKAVPTAEVLTMNSIPIECVAAPGAGKVIDLVCAFVDLDFNSVAYSTQRTIEFLNDTATIYQMYAFQCLAATQSKVQKALFGSAAGDTETQYVENKALIAKVPTANPTAGNSDIVIYGLYRIVEL